MVYKGIGEASDLVSEYVRCEATDGSGSVFMFAFRFGTVGGLNGYNAQPHLVNKWLCFAHIGILTSAFGKDVSPDAQGMSDSRKLAGIMRNEMGERREVHPYVKNELAKAMSPNGIWIGLHSEHKTGIRGTVLSINGGEIEAAYKEDWGVYAWGTKIAEADKALRLAGK